MESADPVLYSVVAVDVEGYGGQPRPEQFDLRRHLGEVLTAACDAAGIDRARWQRQDMGDGELALVPADVSTAQLVIALGHELAVALRQHNLFRRPEGRMRLRVAIHQGAAVVGATGFAGNAVVEAARLLTAPQLRAALTDVPDADLVLIVSDRTYQGLLRDDPPSLDRAAFRRVHVAVRGFEADAWLNVLGYAVRVGPIVGRVGSQRLQEVRAACVRVPASEQLRKGLEQYRVQVLCGVEGTGRSTTALRALDEFAETVSVLDPETDLRQLTPQHLGRRHGYLLDTPEGDPARPLNLALLGHLGEILKQADAYLVLIVDSPAWLEEHAWAEYLVWYHGPDPREVLSVHLDRLLDEVDAATLGRVGELLANEEVNSALRNASGPRQVVDLAARLAKSIRDGLMPEQVLPHDGERGQNGQAEMPGGPQAEGAPAPEPRIARDYWTPDDRLGYDQYADAIAAVLPKLDSQNPREIKRFINLFRFYTFITQQHRLGGAAVPTGRQIAKLAILAIRWPQLLKALGRKVTGDSASTVLAHLEQRARSRAGQQSAGEATSSDRWYDALVEVGLAADAAELSSKDFSWAEGFRQFLESEPSIAAVAERLL